MSSPGPIATLLGLAAILVSPGAHAQAPATQPDYAAAKQHYQTAEEASAKGDHALAAKEYGIAYDITKDPVLFFKIGQSFDKAGDCTSAQVYYGRYLKEGNPSEEFKVKTEEAMKACGEKAAGTATGAGKGVLSEPGTGTGTGTGSGSGSGTGSGVVGAPPSLTEEAPTWQKTAAWTSVGIGIALLTTGAVLGLSAVSREEDVQNLVDFRDAENQPATFSGATRERYDDLIEEGERLESLAVVALAASGVAAASAVLFFILDPGTEETGGGSALRPTAGPDGVGLSFGGRF
jgi:hypothetical protein